MHESLKHKLLLGLIGVSVLPIFFFVHLPSAFNTHGVALYLSAICGYVGLVLLLWMYILGAKSVIGLYFRDMPWVMRVHNWLGKYGTLLVFAHPLLVGIAYSENLLTYTFIPNFSDTFSTSVTYGRIALYSLLVIWVTSAIVRGKIKFRPWKYIHYVAYVALPLSLLHIPAIGTTYQGQPAAVAYFYSILAVFILFSFVRIRQLFGLGKTSHTVLSHKQIAPDIMLLRLKPTGNRKLRILGGQYIYLQIQALGEEHPFSVLDSNDQTGEILVAYKVFGAFTRKLQKVPVGFELLLDGPYGTFTEEVRNSVANSSMVYIAGGIGVTPFFRYIMNDINPSQTLFYATKSPETAALRPVLRQKLGERYVEIYSDESVPMNPAYERGHISAQIIQKHIDHPAQHSYFICGAKHMMESATSALLSLGVDRKQIHSEAFDM